MTERLAAAVAVVGAGPAGIAAAVTAAEAGASVVLLDEAPRPGGQVWRHRGAPPPAALGWLERLARARLATLAGATVFDAPDGQSLAAEREGNVVSIRFDRLVVATGARELFLPFPGWTLPGVIGVGAAHALLGSGASFAGRSVVVSGSGPLLLSVGASLAREGARVVAVVEQAPRERLGRFALSLLFRPGKLGQGVAARASLLGVPYLTGSWVRAAEGAGRVARAVVTDGAEERIFACDVLACGYGLVPNLELPRLLGCAVERGAVVVDRDQRTSVPHVFAAGELCGIGGVDQALVTGAVAGLAAAGRPVPERLFLAARRESAFAGALAAAFALRDELRRLASAATVVCRCEDVPLGRLDPALGARQAKLSTRAGMGPCQGRVCGAALSFLHGWEADAVRPPLKPVPVSALEGDA